MIETGDNAAIFSVAFHSDGMQLLGGSTERLQRWRIADRQEVGNQMAMDVDAISVSTDGKWIVCGTTTQGESVWDAKTQEMAIEVEGTNDVNAVDISPESTRFATTARGDVDKSANIWSIITGEKLVGPLQHDGFIVGIKFSPNGEHIATAVAHSNRVFDSHNGDQLITIKAGISQWAVSTPLAWSNDGQQFFVACGDLKIKSFDVSTGSQLAESQVHDESDGARVIPSIALATNGKFLATFTGRSISFCDTSTLTRINPLQSSRTVKRFGRLLSPQIAAILRREE